MRLESLEERQLLAAVASFVPDENGIPTCYVTTLQDSNDSGDDYVSLREAINAIPAPNSDVPTPTPVIKFSVSGTITVSSQLAIGRSVTIDGETDNGNIVVDGGHKVDPDTGEQISAGVSILKINGNTKDVELKNLTLRNGNASANSGGAIYVGSGSTLAIQGVTLQKNQGSNGGAVYVSGSATKTTIVDVYDSAFKSNTATTNGGAIFSKYVSLNFFGECSFSDNSSANGGAIYADTNSNAHFYAKGERLSEETAVAVDGSYAFNNNTATTNGGAIYAKGLLTFGSVVETETEETGEITRTEYGVSATFENNKATGGNGGAVDVESSSTALTIVGATNEESKTVTFLNNTAGTNGGAIYANLNASSGNAYISNVKMTENKASWGAVTDPESGEVIVSAGSGGNGGAVHIKAATTEFIDVQMKNNSAYKGEATTTSFGHGGAVYANGGTVTIDGGSYSENVATENGGAVYVNSGLLNVDSGLFSKNTAIYGGAIWTKVTMSINSADFTQNNALADGGAIWINYATTTIKGGTFDDNHAVDNGGAIANIRTLEIAKYNDEDTQFTNNTASNGGAIYCSTDNTSANFPKVTIDGATLESNTASNNGGAIYAHNYRTTLKSAILTHNEAGQNGGSVYVDGTAGKDFSVTGSTLSYNNAANGGAVYNSLSGAGANLEMEKIELQHNVATMDGGAIYVAGQKTSIKNGTLSDNEARSNGGAIYIGGESSSTVSLASNTFTNNTATLHGGAIYNDSNKTVDISATSEMKTTFNGNRATRGGAIANYGKAAINNDAEFVNNMSTPLKEDASKGGFGGAIYNVGTFEINNTSGSTVFNGNKATDERTGEKPFVNKIGALNGYSGGAIYNSDGTIIAKNVEFKDNFAGKYGGAVSNFGKFEATNIAFTNNVASVGGAVQTAGNAIFKGATTFTGNKALRSVYSLDGEADFGGNGGAIFASGDDNDFSLTNTITFDGNLAANAGGAIDYIGGSLNIRVGSFVLKNNIAGTIGGAMIVANDISFMTTGVDLTFEVDDSNALGNVSVSDEDDVFHKSVESGDFACAPVVAATNVSEENIGSIVTTILNGSDVLLYTFSSYKELTSNILTYGDLARSFSSEPQIIVAEVNGGDPIYLSSGSGAAIALETAEGSTEGSFTVRYWDSKQTNIVYVANILVKDDASVSFSQINLPASSNGYPVGARIQITSDSNTPVAKWELDWGDETDTTESNKLGFTFSAYHIYDESREYEVELTTWTDPEDDNTIQTYTFVLDVAEVGSDAVLDADADFFADLELVDELFEN